jgi:hypothetical protein
MSRYSRLSAAALLAERGAGGRAAGEGKLLVLLKRGELRSWAETYTETELVLPEPPPDDEKSILADIEAMRHSMERELQFGYFPGIVERRREGAYELPPSFWVEIARDRETYATVAWSQSWAQYRPAPDTPVSLGAPSTIVRATGIYLEWDRIAEVFAVDSPAEGPTGEARQTVSAKRGGGFKVQRVREALSALDPALIQHMTNKELHGAVSKWLSERGLAAVDESTVRRAAGRRS